MLNSFIVRVVAAFILISTASVIVKAACTSTALSVVGNTLRDANNNTVIFHGVDRPGSEYMCVGTTGTNGTGFFDSTINTQNDDGEITAMASWAKLNAVMLPLNEECWLGINGVAAAFSGTNYINAIKHDVATIESKGFYPILELQWEAAGGAQALSQIPMPDNDHAPAFWQSVANTFKTDQKVVFRPKEEPYPGGNSDTTASWTCLMKGDVQYDASGSLTPISTISNCSEGYTTVGLQSIINIIRGTGATNVIAVSGVEFSSRLDHFLDAGIRPTDTLNPPQLIAALDVYPITSPCNTTACYNSEFGPVAAVMPLWAGEIGEDAGGGTNSTTAVDNLITWLDGHGAGYGAWAWVTYGNDLQLIASYGTGTPQAPWGTDYKAHLATLP